MDAKQKNPTIIVLGVPWVTNHRVGILRGCVFFWKSERFKKLIVRKYQDSTPVKISQKGIGTFSKLNLI